MSAGKLSFISLLYVIIWCVSPPLAYGGVFRVLAVVGLLFCLMSSYSGASTVQVSRLRKVVGLCLYAVLVSFVTGESVTLKMGMFVLLLVSVTYDLWYTRFQFDRKGLTWVLLCIFILYSIWNTTTLLAVLEYDRVMRELVRASAISELYASKGVGGYGYLYSAVIALPIAIDIIRQKKFGIVFKLLAIYFVVTTYAITYLSQYLIALITAVFIPVLLYIGISNNNSNRMIAYMLSIMIFALIALNLNAILDFFIDVVDINSIQRKLVDMQNMLNAEEDIEDSEFGTRYERYSRDLGLILSSPLWGSLTFAAVGKHSSFLDTMAQYGIPFGVIFIQQILYPIKVWTKKKESVAVVTMIVVCVIALMNPLPLSASVPISIALPTYCLLKCPK